MNQIFKGKVIRLRKEKLDKNAKMATVELFFNKLHPKYHKPMKIKRKIHAHNEEYDLQLGDRVVIKSSKPYSKIKTFLVIKKEEK